MGLRGPGLEELTGRVPRASGIWRRCAVIGGVRHAASMGLEGSKELRRHGRVATVARHQREVVRPALAAEDR